jgi:glycosyltransferase involved in cell wall biosynthesis
MNDIGAEYPVFSIVTPSYNQGEFLAETIESVISQEGEFTIDYIIVDGGSTDNSVEIIRDFDIKLKGRKWPISCKGINFRWLSEKDQGQSDALAKGFRMAQGGIFAWLNSDDVYLPGALRTVATFFREHSDSGLLYGEAHYCDTESNVIGRYRTEEFSFVKLAWFNFICQPSAFFRNEVFEAVGGLDETLNFAMDYDLWIRVGKQFPCRYIPDYLSMYRLHDASKTISDDNLQANSEEGLRLAMKYFGWAPLTRIYNACNFTCKAHLPRLLTENRTAVTAATILCTLFRSLRLNRGVRLNDLKLLNGENFRKIFKSRLEIMTGSDPGESGRL